jgi:hypothetical protein
MKGEKTTKIFLYSWQPAGTYHKSLAIWILFFSFEIWGIWAIFSMKNRLYM